MEGNRTVLMTEEFWGNSQLSIAAMTGGIEYKGVSYIIVNKEGKDIFECTHDAILAGRKKAIEPGEPCDLVDIRYVPVYRAIGRDRFIEMLKADMSLEQMKSEAGINNKKPSKKQKI